MVVAAGSTIMGLGAGFTVQLLLVSFKKGPSFCAIALQELRVVLVEKIALRSGDLGAVPVEVRAVGREAAALGLRCKK